MLKKKNIILQYSICFLLTCGFTNLALFFCAAQKTTEENIEIIFYSFSSKFQRGAADPETHRETAQKTKIRQRNPTCNSHGNILRLLSNFTLNPELLDLWPTGIKLLTNIISSYSWPLKVCLLSRPDERIERNLWRSGPSWTHMPAPATRKRGGRRTSWWWDTVRVSEQKANAPSERNR